MFCSFYCCYCARRRNNSVISAKAMSVLYVHLDQTWSQSQINKVFVLFIYVKENQVHLPGPPYAR